MMKKLMLMGTMAAFAMAPATTTAQTHGLNRADMNLNVNPGDDFYEYAGGGWMKANPLKAEYPSYGVFNDLAEKNRKQLKELFTDLAKQKHAKGSVGQKVTDLYNLAMDSDRLNREGASPLKQDLADVAAFKRSDLTAFLAKTHLTLGNPFFGIGVETDLKNSDMNVMWMSAGTSGLPDRDYYLNTDADSKKLQQTYRDFIAKMFMMCGGYKKAAANKAAKTIYDIEYQFAQKILEAALNNLDATRQLSLSKSKYLVTIDNPKIPDESLWPRPFVATMVTFVVTLFLLSAVSLLISAIKEHMGI